MKTVEFFAMLLAVCFLGVSAQAQKVVRLEDAKVANASERVRFENALQIADAIGAPTNSRVAMVLTAGNPSNDWSLGITAIVHTKIPQGSLIGLRILRPDGITYLDGVSTWGRDILPGEGFVVKSPGGGTLYQPTKQYEFVVVDANTLVTTVDYIPLYENVIQSSPTFGFSSVNGDAYLQVPLTADALTIDSVVINGNVVPRALFSTGPNGVLVDLTQFGVCLGTTGDVSVTIVRGGKSDTTQFRFPSNLPQACGGSKG